MNDFTLKRYLLTFPMAKSKETSINNSTSSIYLSFETNFDAKFKLLIKIWPLSPFDSNSPPTTGPLCQKCSLPVRRNRKPIDRGKPWPLLSSWCPEWGSLPTIAKTYQRSSTSGRNPETEVEGSPNRCWRIQTASSGPVPSRAVPEHAVESWLSLWQARHSLAHLATSFLRPCHTNHSPTSRAVALAPGSDRLWRAWKMVWRNAAGTHGLRHPWEMSQRSMWPLISTSFDRNWHKSQKLGQIPNFGEIPIFGPPDK